MKSIVSRVVVALLVVTLAGVSAFAKTKKARVSFLTDVKVNGTTIKKGVYNVEFDDQTGDLSILKDNKVLAKTSTRTEKRDTKAKATEAVTSADSGETALVSIAFSGTDQNILIVQPGTQSGK